MADYPALSTGAVVQVPWSFSRRFETSKNDMETGQRYAWSNRATAKRTWTVTYSDITDAEIATLKAFFDSVSGRLGTFGFTDPKTGTYYAAARFDTDSFERKHVSKNHSSLSLTVIA